MATVSIGFLKRIEKIIFKYEEILMNIRPLYLVLCMSSMSFTVHAALTVQQMNRLLETGILNVAGFADSVGAYFNLCRPPLSQAIVDTASSVGNHLKNLQMTNALDAVSQTTAQMTNQELPYAPATTFFEEYMREAKAVIITLAVITSCCVVYRMFSSGKKKKH